LKLRESNQEMKVLAEENWQRNAAKDTREESDKNGRFKWLPALHTTDKSEKKKTWLPDYSFAGPNQAHWIMTRCLMGENQLFYCRVTLSIYAPLPIQTSCASVR
jgi:hypothetical protein